MKHKREEQHQTKREDNSKSNDRKRKVLDLQLPPLTAEEQEVLLDQATAFTEIIMTSSSEAPATNNWEPSKVQTRRTIDDLESGATPQSTSVLPLPAPRGAKFSPRTRIKKWKKAKASRRCLQEGNNTLRCHHHWHRTSRAGLSPEQPPLTSHTMPRRRSRKLGWRCTTNRDAPKEAPTHHGQGGRDRARQEPSSPRVCRKPKGRILVR
jgi:hypothetical protein